MEKKTKVKIGSRTLEDDELRLLLPDYEKIYRQINMFREDVDEESRDGRINNISILGQRGVGKTSVLKTIAEKIKADDNKDVILPIIVPEKMSSCSVLMDNILGMLKNVVDERENAEEERRKGRHYSDYCDCVRGEGRLKLKYNELIRQYCYIKSDYRNILIRQFTTEQTYINKNQLVFNSDKEFERAFDSFLDELLIYDENSTDKRPMLFVFIDDIDLSNTRCMDVAKTLLSYLSKQRIITIIAGDYNNFAEAMTLEFLRQEKILESGSVDENFGSDANTNILESRRRMSFEYLRKIMPPTYRYDIKIWSLKERRKFYSGEESDTLGELLDEYIKGTGCIFAFKDKNEDKGNILEEDEFLEYCIFDDTSRGLNNIYNVLIDLNNNKDPNDSKDSNNNRDKGHKTLIETIVQSKYLFMEHKQEILSDIIALENEKFSVDFGKAKSFFEKSDGVINDDEKISCFFLFEFCRQLFGQNEKDDSEYRNLKIEILEKILNRRGSDEREAKFGELRGSENYHQVVIDSIITDSNFIVAIHFMNHMSYELLKEIYVRDYTQNNYRISICTLYALSVTANEIGSVVIEKEIADIPHIDILINDLSGDNMINYGNLIFNRNLNSLYGLRYIKTGSVLGNLQNYVYQFSEGYVDKNETEYAINFASALFCCDIEKEYTKNVAVILQNDILRIVKKSIIKTILYNLGSAFGESRIKKLTDVYYDSDLNDEKYKVIYSIEKNNMWKNKFVIEKVGKYIKDRVQDLLNKFQKNILFFDISALETDSGALKRFFECDEGASKKNKIKNCKRSVKNIIHLYGDVISGYISLGQLCMLYQELNSFVHNHENAIYGLSEARTLLKEIQELPIKLFDKYYDDEIKGEMCAKLKDKEDAIVNDPKGKCLYNKKQWKTVEQYVEHCNEEYLAGQKSGQGISYSTIMAQDSCISIKYRPFVGYLAYKKEFEDAVKKSDSNNADIVDWDETLLEWDYNIKFILHAYMRYQENTEPEFAKYYIWSEKASEIVPEIDEIKAHNNIEASKELYDVISEDIGISEGKFNELF